MIIFTAGWLTSSSLAETRNGKFLRVSTIQEQPLTLSLPRVQKVHSPNLLKKKCIRELERIDSIIIVHVSRLWKAKFSILCDVIFLVRLQEKIEIDHNLTNGKENFLFFLVFSQWRSLLVCESRATTRSSSWHLRENKVVNGIRK